jgi:GT2 family glycosyltransferase/ADP-heptose:LPS heptosyltransferase
MAEEERIVNRNTRQSYHDKIKAALAKKPTSAMINNRAMPVQELNKIITNQTPTVEPVQPVQRRVIRNVRKKRAMERRPATAIMPYTEAKSDPAPMPEAYLYSVPEWFTPKTKPKISVIIPLFKSNAVVTDQIKTWIHEKDIDVEIIYVDDNCPTNSKATVLKAWEDRGEKKPVGKIVANRENVGYGRACNVGALHASGDYLIFLNSDTKVTEGWIKPMLDLFDNPKVGIVGNLHLKEGGPHHNTVDSAGSAWNWSSMYFEHIGRHHYKGAHLSQPFAYPNLPEDLRGVSEREMVTGCCFMTPAKVFNEVDGFDPRYRIGYWEDSDLCMKVRELGYKILFQPRSIIWHKLSHSGAAGHAHYRENTDFFRNRWYNSGRVDKLLFTPRPGGPPVVKNILVKRIAANGDVLMATSILPALKKKWPKATITFWTGCEQILFGHPMIDKIVSFNPKQQFDYVVNLDLAYEYHPTWSILKSYAFEAGVPVEDCKAYMATKPLRWQLPKPYIVMHAKREEGFGWAGRNWKGDRFTDIADRLRKEGHNIVLVGGPGDWQLPHDLDLRGRTNPQELAAIMKDASFFVGMDSMPMHMAQIFGVPGVVFFGSILPKYRLTGSRLHPINATHLDCLGCHHKSKPPSIGTSSCARGDFACEYDITVDMFWNKIKEVMNGKKTWLPVV